MPWYILPLIAGLLLSLATIFEKKVLVDEHATEFSTIFALFNVALSIPFLIFVNFSDFTLGIVLMIYVASVIGTSSFILFAKSNRHMEISSSSPWLMLTPGISTIVAYIFLGETLSTFQVVGLVIMTIGLYILLSHKHASIFDPLREVIKSKYLHFLIINLVLYSFGVLIDRIVLGRYGVSVLSYLFLFHVFTAINFLFISFVFYDGFKGIQSGIKKYGWWILLSSVLTVGCRFAMSVSISTTLVGLALSMKRLSSLFTVIIGGELFHEKNIGRKIIACVIMFVGILLIVQ